MTTRNPAARRGQSKGRPGGITAAPDWRVQDAGWQKDARCRGADVNLFFGPTDFERKRDRIAREARAKAICAQCPVRRECLDYALAMREPYGVWGGLNEHERRSLVAARAG